jgi:hypothetical protein
MRTVIIQSSNPIIDNVIIPIKDSHFYLFGLTWSSYLQETCHNYLLERITYARDIILASSRYNPPVIFTCPNEEYNSQCHYCIDTILWLNYYPSINHNSPIQTRQSFLLIGTKDTIFGSYLYETVILLIWIFFPQS